MQTSEHVGGSSKAARSDRIWAAVALALLVLLALPVVLQNAHALAAPDFSPPLRTGDDPAAVAAAMGRSRAQNVIVGLAVRAASQPGSRPIVYAPPVLDSLSALPKDTFEGAATKTLQEGLLQPLIAGRLVKKTYVVPLTDAQVAEFEAQGRLVRFPLDVWAVRAAPGQPSPAVVLHTDASGKHIIVVPIAISPAVIR